MKTLSKTIFGLYLLILLWVVLFKFSFDLLAVLDHQSRSFNLIPFIGPSRGSLGETIDNFIAFIPFGLLLSINFKRTYLWDRLTFIFLFSVVAEILQFVLAIGVTDVTDVITNTLGGFIGLVLYDLIGKYVDNEKLDRFIVVCGIILLLALVLLRTLVFRVRY